MTAPAGNPGQNAAAAVLDPSVLTTAAWLLLAAVLFIGLPTTGRARAPGRQRGLLDRVVDGLWRVQVWVPLVLAVGRVSAGGPANPVLTLAVGGLATSVCAASGLRARKMSRDERRWHLTQEMTANLGVIAGFAVTGTVPVPSGTAELVSSASGLLVMQVTSTALLRWPIPSAWWVAQPVSIMGNGTVLAYGFLLQPSTVGAWTSIAVSLTAVVAVVVHLGSDDWVLWWARVVSARRFREGDPRHAEAWLHDEVRKPTGMALAHTMAELAVYDLRGGYRRDQWPPTALALNAGKRWLATAEHLVTLARPHLDANTVALARAHCAFARGQVLEAAADWEAAVVAYHAAAAGYGAAGLPSISALARLFRARLLTERLDRAAEAAAERSAIGADTGLLAQVRRWAGADVDGPADDRAYADMTLRAGLPDGRHRAAPPWLPLVAGAAPGAPAEEHELSRTRHPGTGPAQRMIDRGIALFGRGRHAQGAQELRAAATLLESNSQQLIAMGVLAELARLQSRIDPRAAFDTLEEALRMQERFRDEVVDEPLRLQINGWFESLHSHQIGLLTATRTGRPRPAVAAFDLAERSRSRLLLEQLGTTTLRADRVPDHLVRRERDDLGEIERLRTATAADGRHIAALDAARAARARLGATWREIAATGVRGAEYAQLRRGDPLTFAGLGSLPGQALLAEYHVTEDAVVLLLITSDAPQPLVVRVPLSRAALDRVVTDSFTDVRSADPGDWRALSPLVAPLVEHSTPGQVIWIVPHDHLHGVPLHAVQVDGVPLAERNPTCYTPSAAVMRYCQAKRRPGVARSVVLADSRPDRPLPHSRAHSAVIASLLDGAERFVGEQASVSGLETAMREEVSVLHIACHGEFDAERPARSRVLLARTRTHGAVGDGALTAERILGMSLPADLVTLSACQSGVAHRRAGDELFGLPRALIYAGASAVLVSLWPVDEVATSLLMDSFYRARGAGADKAEALRTAQLAVRGATCADVIDYCGAVGGDERTVMRSVADLRFRAGDFAAAAEEYETLLDSSDDASLLTAHARARLASRGATAPPDYTRKAYAHPYHWAGFVLIGDWR